ncbi:MAG: FHA domain-containing protein [Planctomycetia bacterium]|nr:FHA domain-containing protein [Planctomycetia bacterium]
MDVRLVVANTSPTAKQIRLGAMTLIGRSPDCNLRIASGQVSRRHCLIKVGDSAVTVRDLGSANGTKLNGEPVSTQADAVITTGSTLVVGPLKFIVQFAAPKARADEDTEWLIGTVPQKSVDDVQSLVPPPNTDGEETKDLPPSRRRARSAPPQVVMTGSGDPVPGDPPDEPGRLTEPDLAAVAGETVFDIALEGQPGEAVADAAAIVRRRASETHLVFEEEDLKQMIVEGDLQPMPPADEPSSDDDIDDDLRKFLNES